MTPETLALLQTFGMPIGSIVAALAPFVVLVSANQYQKHCELSMTSAEKMNLNDAIYDRLKKSLSSVKGQDAAINDVIASICGWSEANKTTWIHIPVVLLYIWPAHPVPVNL